MPFCAVPLDPTGSVNWVHLGRRTKHLLRRLGGADPSDGTGVSHLSSTHYPRVLNHPLPHPPCSCLRYLCVESEGVFRRWRTNSCAAKPNFLVPSDSGSRCVNHPDGSCAYSLFDLGTTETRVHRLGSPPLTWITKGAGGGAHMPKYF